MTLRRRGYKEYTVTITAKTEPTQRPTHWDYSQPWYHGSQQVLTALRVGSAITQDRTIARIFSHCPSMTSIYDDGRIKHTGEVPGYLFVIDEPVTAEDVYPHPHPVNASHWEWLTTRELKVKFLEPTGVVDDERLTPEEIAELVRKQQETGMNTFAE